MEELTLLEKIIAAILLSGLPLFLIGFNDIFNDYGHSETGYDIIKDLINGIKRSSKI